MNGRIGGQRPRPRVALVGSFDVIDMEHFRRMFPTIWQAEAIWILRDKVDIREIDLVILASDVDDVGDWEQAAHCVCFSRSINTLPGPTSYCHLQISGNAQTEEFFFPDAPLPISRLREADYGNLTSIRGWPRLQLQFERSRPGSGSGTTETQRAYATSILNKGSIICEHCTNLPLAVAFIREGTSLGVGWLPKVDTNQAAWVELLVTQWAQSDKDTFPNFGDWTASPEWMVKEEEQVLSQIQVLELKKRESVIEIDKQIGELTTKFALAKTNANQGQRRLIAAQGKELVEEVAKALKCIGFDVTDVDELVGEKGLKREDLRLGHLDKDGKDWNAIVEVRGYARSAGTTADLLRLARFANLYKIETGQDPDKRIYIVNGELETLPSQRQEPLASAPEDLQIFADSDGILIWSLDLFRALKATDPADYPALLESIKRAKGRWVI